jgi:hypothetical protein
VLVEDARIDAGALFAADQGGPAIEEAQECPELSEAHRADFEVA